VSLSQYEREELRAAILARFPTVYAFSRATGTTKSVVVQVLKGNYPGNSARQAARIRAALGEAVPAGSVPARVTEAMVLGVLEVEACGRCRRTDRRGCRSCRMLWQRQAGAVMTLFETANSQVG